MNEKLQTGKAQSGSALRLMRNVLLFTIPFWMIVAVYFHDDPYLVLRQYRNYDSDVTLNEGSVGWSIYKNNRDSLRFNSFILGNSCTMAFRCHSWERHLEEGDRAVRLFGNGETMKAVLLKLQALERDGAEIKNILMILDRSSLSKAGLRSGFEHLLPAEVSGKSQLASQLEFLQAFIMPDFLFPYLRYSISGRVSPGMKHMNPYGRVRNSMNNDAVNPRERMIEQEGEAYWKNRMKEFPARDGKAVIAERAIYPPQWAVLNEIACLLQRHGTSLRIIISPDYDQKQLHPSDREALEALFGRKCVFDFSGINEYTADYHYYYEQGHYRPVLGNRLLDAVY